MLPKVTLFNGVSLDGRIDWYAGDLAQYYELAANWQVGAVLTGSNTILSGMMGQETPQEDEIPPEPPQIAPDDLRPLMVIVDSKGRFRLWQWLRQFAYWKDLVALCSEDTPRDYLDYLAQRYVDTIVTGKEHVNLAAALEELNTRYSITSVRADCGGTLNGLLLRSGLVDEVSLLINPYLVGGSSLHYAFTAPDLTSPDGIIPLKLTHVQTVYDDKIWLRYDVVK